MPVAMMFEVIVNAFFFAQPLQQREVAFLVLNTERPRRIVPGRQFKAIAAVGQVMFLQQLAQDHGHAQVRKDAPATLAVQGQQRRHQCQLVADMVGPAMFAAGAM
ncbi:hypothetical protein D3C76_1277750 [compost metagenome]